MSTDRDISHIQLEILNGDAKQDNVTVQSKKKMLNWQNRMCIGILIIIGISLLGYMLIRNQQKPVYVVIIDAGSSGSRVNAFSFHKSSLDGSLTLEGESFAQIEPGLSSFADDPVKGAEFLKVLVEKAKAFVPKSEWAHTPFSLKATAGLRLLPKDKAKRLIEECQKLFGNSGFLTAKESISVMDGIDEGIFSWIAINFLLDRFTAQNNEDTVAALDLGGGSIQVTFAPDSKHIKDQEKDIFNISTVGKNMSIYSHSYLGMGLLAARKEILTSGQNVDTKDNNKSQVSVIEVDSECVNPTISTKWNYGGVNYLVKGLRNEMHKVLEPYNLTKTDDRSGVRFSKCLKIVKKYVGTIVNKPLGLEKQKIVAFSYFFNRAVEVGLADPSNGQIVTVDAFLKQAMVHCDNPEIEHPFMCLDLTFIYVLLLDGFNLQQTTKLELKLMINDYKVGWALGAALNILHNGH